MIGPGHFLCGCNPKDPHVMNYKRDVVVINGEPTLTSKRYDKKGREICPIHGQPLYGHATPFKTGPQGNDISDLAAEYKVRYGDAKRAEIVSTVPDLRDNRDPAVVGAGYLKRRRQKSAHTNGS